MHAGFKISHKKCLHSSMLHVYEMDETPPQNKGDQHEQPDAFQF